jgi:hypothetical protein
MELGTVFCFSILSFCFFVLFGCSATFLWLQMLCLFSEYSLFF